MEFLCQKVRVTAQSRRRKRNLNRKESNVSPQKCNIYFIMICYEMDARLKEHGGCYHAEIH